MQFHLFSCQNAFARIYRSREPQSVHLKSAAWSFMGMIPCYSGPREGLYIVPLFSNYFHPCVFFATQCPESDMNFFTILTTLLLSSVIALPTPQCQCQRSLRIIPIVEGGDLQRCSSNLTVESIIANRGDRDRPVRDITEAQKDVPKNIQGNSPRERPKKK
ncbi:hypothetical protein J3R30DRAFT_556934 [Lentinula aciculospora]|uniref:Uncharacterized protein n=1 Tax=Lentinula aciculospora TaxID=153920 RepID=A0A9W9A6D2_9AGAR|nr:hypothetical protein J3R30DRAFT_556934 [Lentinula aciculospora]